MTKLKMLVELDYDADTMHGTDGDSVRWFAENVLGNTTEDGRLVLHSNEIGDEVGTVLVLWISDWPPNVEVEATGAACRDRSPRT